MKLKREEKLFIGFLLVVCLGGAINWKYRLYPKRDAAAQKRFEELQNLKMELTAERTEWKAREPIDLTLKITNPSENDVLLVDFMPSMYRYQITVTGRYYLPIAERDEQKLLRAQGVVSALTTGVRSKRTQEEKIPISRYFQMDKSGIYRIKVKRLMGDVSETERFFYRESDTLTISVVK
jgi:hypothetical protein